MKDTYGYTIEGSGYYEGHFSTPEAAALHCGRDCIVGKYREPLRPELCIEAGTIFEEVCCQDDYAHDEGEQWPGCTAEQQAELTDAFRSVFSEWLDRHNLRPGFLIADEDSLRRFEVKDGKAIDKGPAVESAV